MLVAYAELTIARSKEQDANEIMPVGGITASEGDEQPVVLRAELAQFEESSFEKHTLEEALEKYNSQFR